MQYLPSKKFFVFALLALFVLGGFWTLSGEKNDILTKQKELATALSILGDTIKSGKDTDTDGLLDWEEKLFGTDPKNPDSDGNGTLDGEQFAAEKEYQNLSEKDVEGIYNLRNGISVLSAQPGNLTNSLFREAAYRYGYVTEQGEVDEETKQKLVDSLARDFEFSKPLPYFTKENISVANDSAIETVQKYIAGILIAFEKNKIVYEIDPLETINTWFETEDESLLELLKDLANAYEKISSDVASLSAPTDLMLTHLELGNNIFYTKEAVLALIQTSKDPIKSMLSTAQYLQLKNNRAHMIASLLNYFNAQVALNTSPENVAK